ncbi:MAG: hypothetical protein U9R38_01350 [Candidatus Margulisiibacteriota bacterium]|nr:hypothetical protein [Candidatus Margulisiibacteriota bacterium]
MASPAKREKKTSLRIHHRQVFGDGQGDLDVDGEEEGDEEEEEEEEWGEALAADLEDN